MGLCQNVQNNHHVLQTVLVDILNKTKKIRGNRKDDLTVDRVVSRQC